MKLTDFNTDNALGYIIANANTTKNNLIEVCGLSGKGLAVGVTDYAAIGTVTYGTPQTSAATGQILAQTSVIAGVPAAYARQAAVRNSAGDIFICATYSVANGVKLYKYSACGNLVATTDVDTTAAASTNHQIFLLSSGNICVVFNINSALKFAIYDTNLVVVKSLTSILATTLQNAYFAATALSGGGFAVVYADTVNNLISRLVTYSNTGTAVLTATDIWTRTGTNGIQFHKMVQLSSGNLAFAISSNNTVSSIGLYYGITDTSGAIVKAFTNLNTTAAGYSPELVSTGAGHFAVARPNGTNHYFGVFDNAGTIVSFYNPATTAGDSINKTKLVASSTVAYLIWHRNTDSKTVITSLPVSGASNTDGVITTTTTQYNFFIDAFYEDAYIVGISMASSGAVAPQMWVVDAANLALVNNAGTTFGTAPVTTNGQYPRVISGGDRAFIAVYDYASVAALNLCLGKWASTAVLGPAVSTTTSGSSIPLHVMAGVYRTTAINGAPSKAFDMTASTVVGNKGTMLAGGSVVLRGIGV